MMNLLDEFKNKSYEVLLVTGKDNYDEIAKTKLTKNVKIVQYKEKMGEVNENNILEKSHEIETEEKNKTKKIIEEMRKSLNQIIELKNNQQMNSINFYKDIRKLVVRPKDLC